MRGDKLGGAHFELNNALCAYPGMLTDNVLASFTVIIDGKSHVYFTCMNQYLAMRVGIDKELTAILSQLAGLW